MTEERARELVGQHVLLKLTSGRLLKVKNCQVGFTEENDLMMEVSLMDDNGEHVATMYVDLSRVQEQQ